jgi:hypothetical protein
MKISETVTLVLMVGLLVFSGIKFGQNNLSEKKLQILIETSSKLSSGGTIEYREKKSLDGILRATSSAYINEVPVHAGIISSILKKIFFAAPQIKSKVPTSAEISRKFYFNYLKIIDLAVYSGKYLFIAGLAVVILGFLSNKLGFYFVSSVIGRTGFFLSRVLLSVLAGVILLAWILIKAKFWVPVNITLFGAPVVFLVLSGIALKLHDPNFPLWNRIMKSLILPFVTAFIIVGNAIFFTKQA